MNAHIIGCFCVCIEIYREEKIYQHKPNIKVELTQANIKKADIG